MKIEQKSFPKGWQAVTVVDACEKISLNGIKIKQKDYLTEGKFPVVDQGQELIGGYYNDDSLVVPGVPPYIVFGDHTRVKKFINFQFIGGADGVKVLKPKSFFDPKLFYYFIHAVKIPDKGYARHFQYLEKATIPLPPLAEQQRIVTKIEELLSELDAGKQELEKAKRSLKVYRQAVLKWAFEGKLTNAAVAYGGLPDGWKLTTLKDVCYIIGGVTKGRDLKGNKAVRLPYLRVANVQDGYLDLNQMKEIEVLPSDKEKYRLLKGDILYTEGGDKDKLGRGAVWNNEIEDCIHQNHIFRARPKNDEISSLFLAYYSQTKFAKNYFFKHGKQTTNLASINITTLSNLPVFLPPLDEQQRVVQEIEVRLSVCDKIEETIVGSLQQAEALRQGILKKAFEGKLVEQDSDDGSIINLLHKLRTEKALITATTAKPARKMQNKNPQKAKEVLQLLQENRGIVGAKDLWLSSIYREDIEAFYEKLKVLSLEGKIEEGTRKGKESFIKLMSENEN